MSKIALETNKEYNIYDKKSGSSFQITRKDNGHIIVEFQSLQVVILDDKHIDLKSGVVDVVLE
jgi:hypothetical protein